jgi:hypothetical protein
MLAVLMALGVSTALAGAFGIQHRANLLDQVVASQSAAPLKLLLDVNDANATMTTAFVGSPTDNQLGRYRQDITRATSGLTVVAASSSADAIVGLSTELPVYTGLVEDAVLVYHQRDFTPQDAKGLALHTLREAAAMAMAHVLPDAQALYERQTAILVAAQDGAGEFPWVAISLGFLFVGCLVAVQFYLTQGTRRRFNIGLIAATVVTLAATGWLGVASSVSAGHSQASRQDGSSQITALADLWVAGMQARSDAAMTVIASDNGPEDFAKPFRETKSRLTAADGLIARAQAAVSQPDTRSAVDSAAENLRQGLIAPSDPGFAARFDTQLSDAMEQASARLDDDAKAARDALSGVAGWVAVLLGIAIFGAVAGMWPRIAEYR